MLGKKQKYNYQITQGSDRRHRHHFLWFLVVVDIVVAVVSYRSAAFKLFSVPVRTVVNRFEKVNQGDERSRAGAVENGGEQTHSIQEKL